MDLPSFYSQTTVVTDEWELCNDDGFIYKREKRRRVLTEPSCCRLIPRKKRNEGESGRGKLFSK
ncbi:hypothetical protein J1N35_031462 [Gossypium stocksii]|uniref:Uncharacterized protein n=1 Tax=Gossypium stocksii TaxID=47602 RepID=A0A9D3ZVC6_9ROSI|nr:hypothetical protein J1N35_031462 [Gossypium stocksii]